MAFSNSSNAQTIGIKSGYTDAWQHYGAVPLPPDAETHVRGYNVSLEYYKELNKWLNIGIEPGVVRRGAACVPGWNGGIEPIFEGDTKWFLTYAELPVAAQASIPLFSTNFRVFAKAGYGLSYMIAGKQETIDFRMPQSTVEDMNLKNSSLVNRLDHGFYSGVGLAYQLKSHQIFFEFDFYTGMRDAERFNTSKNRDSDFSMGYRFNLGR